MKILFVTLFVLFLVSAVYYGSLNLVIYERQTMEFVQIPGSDLSVEKKVTRVYHENYGAIGAAIGFSILSAASLLAFAHRCSIQRSAN